MGSRSPYITEIVRDWAKRGDDYICTPGSKMEHKIIDAWIAAHPQKPFVVSSITTPDERRMISILCTRCADIHNHMMPLGILSDGTKRIPALCEDKYRTEDTYEYVDWGIGNKFIGDVTPVPVNEN